ncbi:AAA family ATPase [Clostridium sp. MB40-C1]|uniref:HelD family protein n=1 Tax=Clostridium sp. MB40-C1 TaxID=3070996 RepID=UPI0027DF0A5B|nr:UvrD-helicase domain-containing protein [Clostridium sp. MB40-C1]WMJ80564.1 AAA family ATPase [Clostridium sp. MB40-C1]
MKNNDFEKEIQKEIQLEFEKSRLNDTINIIKEEIINCIKKRKSITQYLVDTRKNAVEEYRDDEDKLIEYFDHERFVREESFKSIDRKLKEFTILQPSPYFGKVTFEEKDVEGEEYIYIGRFGVTPEEAYEPVVVDWRAPISSLFYAGKLGNVEYSAPSGKIQVDVSGKRQFIIKKENLLGMFDSEVDVKDEILQMVLSKNAEDKLKDIIMTIQQEQDDLIRQPRDKTIVVDGIAGSGKTTIALHRVAYLLYNYRKILQDKVLILGPNSIFMEYISTVLPSLGEIGVRQQTFSDFAIGILELNTIMEFREYMEKIINKDEEFIKEILFKTSKGYIKELNKFIEILNKKYFITEDLVFENTIIVPKEAIKDLFDYYKSMPLFRRSKKIKRILFAKIRDKRDEKVREIEKWYRESLSKMDEEKKNLEGSELIFKRKLKIREVIKNAMTSKKYLKWLDNEKVIDLYNNLNGNKVLTIDDLAPILYLKIKLEGLKLEEEIKHVVIDEAQDYSLLQFIVIKELTKCKAFTIVGDKNQRLIPVLEDIPMLNLNEVLDNVEYFNLNKSYRSTKEIMEYANRYLAEDKIVPLVRSGDLVVDKSINSKEEFIKEIENILGKLNNEGLESIAIICKNKEEAKEVYSLVNRKMGIKLIDSEEIIYNKGGVVIPAYYAKGLEFDAAIIINCEDEQMIKEDKLMYVMATRALHKLYVYNVNLK